MQAQQAGGSVADFMTENKIDRPILNIQFDTTTQSSFANVLIYFFIIS